MYRVAFINQGKIYEIYAKSVTQGAVYGFVEIEDLVFETGSSLLVDPSAEKLQQEFSGVHRTLVPIHSVIRIDEVEKQGAGKITELDGSSNVTPFPSPYISPGKKPER